MSTLDLTINVHGLASCIDRTNLEASYAGSTRREPVSASAAVATGSFAQQ